jgi:hypothetical protein
MIAHQRPFLPRLSGCPIPKFIHQKSVRRCTTGPYAQNFCPCADPPPRVTGYASLCGSHRAEFSRLQFERIGIAVHPNSQRAADVSTRAAPRFRQAPFAIGTISPPPGGADWHPRRNPQTRKPTTGLGTGSIQDNSPDFAERLAPRLPTKPHKPAPLLPRKTPSVHNEE